MPQQQPIFHAIATPSRLHIPISSRLGKLGANVKRIGTVVSSGELLTESRPESDAAAIAPRPGKIAGVVKTTLCNGEMTDAVAIETIACDSTDITSTETQPRHLIRTTDLGIWIDRLLAAGVSASRIGCPDLVDQLHQCLNRPIDTVLCCVLDSDPSLPMQSTIAQAYSAELAAGIDLLSKLLGARRVWVAADPAFSTAWFGTLDPLIRADGLRLVPLRSDYPQADPTLLLHALLRRRLRPRRLPVEQGVLLLDAPAAVAIGHVFLHGRPMFDLPLAIRDHVMRKTHFVLAPVGTGLDDLCKSINIPPESAVFRGGEFLRDVCLPANAVIGPGELTIHVSPREIPLNPDPCIRCGWCIEACPTRIHPVGLLEAAQREDIALAEKFGLDSCIECGICSYVCPSRLPLLGAIRRMKPISDFGSLPVPSLGTPGKG